MLFVLLRAWHRTCRRRRPRSKEYQIKAAFLFNFAQFVEWPPTAFTNADAPFCIGVLGDDPFGAALDETVQGENSRTTIKLIVQCARTASRT